MDRNFPLLKMSISLDSAAKKITLGSQKKQTLTEITKFDNEAAIAEMEDKLDTAIGEIMPEIDDIKGIPDLEDFISKLDEYDWDNHNIPDDLQDLLDQFKDSPSLPDMRDALDDLRDKLDDYQNSYDDYDSLKSLLDSLDSDLDLAENPQSLYEQSQAIQQISVNGGGSGGGSGSTIGSGQWTIQVNGVTQASGTMNFVT